VKEGEREGQWREEERQRVRGRERGREGKIEPVEEGSCRDATSVSGP